MLLAEPDCGVIAANLAFGDQVANTRFGVAAKTLVPRAMFQGRWVLMPDADEFLLMPEGLDHIDALVGALDAAGLRAARAVMLDFFPSTLRALAGASAGAHPLPYAQLRCVGDIGMAGWGQVAGSTVFAGWRQASHVCPVAPNVE